MEFWFAVLALWLFYEGIRRRNYQRENDERIARLGSELEEIEQKIRKLKELPTRTAELGKASAESVVGPRAPTPGSAQPASTPTTEPSAESPRTFPPPVIIPPAPIITSARTTVPPPAVIPPVAPFEASNPTTQPPIRSLQAARPSTAHVQPVPAQQAEAEGHDLAVRRKSVFDIEETLGKHWLNKIGITALVIGIALFLAYKLPSLSNPAKVGLGYTVSLSLLGTGVVLERKDRYRLFARALIGGGWALTFFTTYAMYFVNYTKIIQAQWIDLSLLFIVAALMVTHTLRYDSQVVTGLAFLLAFTTVAISQNTVYSLSAGAILAVGLVAIVRLRSWFELEIFGLLASYLNHYYWLRTVIQPMGASKHSFPEFIPSALLLILYWAVFRWSYITRRIRATNQEHVSTLAALLNTSFLLALMRYQAIQPSLAFYALLAVGAVELCLGQLPLTRRRRSAFLILTTIGITLLVAAIPFKFSGMRMSIVWLAEAQALFLAGVFTREVLFRRFGLLAALLTLGNMLTTDFAQILRMRSASVANSPEYRLALCFLTAALLFYANSHWIPRRWKDLLGSDFEKECFRGLSYVASLALLVGGWLAFPGTWTAVSWSTLALVLLIIGSRLDLAELSNQSHAFAAAALAWTLIVNRVAAARVNYLGVTQRLETIPLVILLFYLCARWRGKAGGRVIRGVSELYTTGAALLIALLAYYECHWALVAIAWAAFALTLAVAGQRLDRWELSFQAHALAAAAFIRTLLVNVDATQQYRHFMLRLITLSLVAALLYLSARFSGPRESDFGQKASGFYTWSASLIVAVLAYKELSSPWVVVAWMAFALLLLIVGHALKREELPYQAHLLAIASVTYALTVNLYTAETYRLGQVHLSSRLVTVALAAILLYISSRWARRALHTHAGRVADAYAWAGSLLVSLLMWYELPPLNVALAWVLFGLVLFEIGFSRQSLSWRLQSYVALTSGFLRIFFVNINAPHVEMLVTTLPLALVFYNVYARLQSNPGDFLAMDRELRMATVLSYFGSVALAAIIRFWLDPDWVAAGWAVLAAAFLAMAWRTQRKVFLQQGFLAGSAVLFRALFFNFVERSHPASGWLDSRTFQVGTAAGLLLGALAIAFPLRKSLSMGLEPSRSHGKLATFLQRPELFFFFVPLSLVTVLIAKEVPSGLLTVTWGIEAIMVFLFALAVSQRTFRLTGLGLLLFCVAKIMALDVWRQQKSERFTTFIIMGTALLLVSFLYTRYSEAIKRYL